jgi:outer membrane protein assembly factor BamB
VHIFPCLINYSEVDSIRPHKPLLLIAVILIVTILGAVPATHFAAGADETAVFCYDVQCTGHYSPMLRNSASEGRLNWNYMTKGDVFSSPAAVDGIVYIGSLDHDVYALNATNGTKVWNYTTGDHVYSSPTVAGGIIYVGSEDVNLSPPQVI